jgi:hypothetical protein
MGCHMASYSSDLELFYTTDEEKLVNKWLSIRQQERSHDTNERGYEVTILVNGQPLQEVDYEKLQRMSSIVAERHTVWSKQQDEEDARKKEKEKQNEAAAERRRERVTYLQLKEKFGDQP